MSAISDKFCIFTYNFKQLNNGEKAQKSTENVDQFQEALERLNKQYGKGTVLALEDKVEESYDTISTGSIGFDWITLGVEGSSKVKCMS